MPSGLTKAAGLEGFSDSISVKKLSTPLRLSSAIVRCLPPSPSRHVFSQDFQNQAILGQETKAKSSYSSVDSDENWQQNQVQLQEKTLEENEAGSVRSQQWQDSLR